MPAALAACWWMLVVMARIAGPFGLGVVEARCGPGRDTMASFAGIRRFEVAAGFALNSAS